MAIESGYLDDLADADLVLRFKAGNDHALDVLLRRHSEDLSRLCCRLTANKEDAEDIYQESLVRAIDNVTTLQSGSAFRGWLFRIARNLSVDSFRFRRRVCQLPDEEHTPLPLHVDGPHAGVEIGEEHVTVSEALQRLAQSHRDVLVLREVEGLSYADIADRLNLSKSAVETLLFRARRRLREEYAKRTSGVALLAGLQEFGPRLTGETTVTKVAVTAAVLGGAVISTPHVFPHRVTGNTSATAPVRAHQRQVNRLALRTAPTILHGGTGLSDGARAAIRSASRQAAPRSFRHTFVPRRLPAVPSKTMHRRDRPARRPSLGLVSKHLVHAMARQGQPHRQAAIVAMPSTRLVSAGKPAVNRSLRAGA
ncbi:MAG TPA: RNA polymerase sigma factor, partial [Chloroflexota bacterium]